MVAKKPAKAAKAASKVNEVASPEEKIARLLGLLVIKDLEHATDKVILLRTAGFRVSEVAAMLGMTENHVNVAAFMGRKKKPRKKMPSTDAKK